MVGQDGVVRPPSISEIAFNCPHCGALAKQFWFAVRADALKDSQHPAWFTQDELDELIKGIKESEAQKKMERFASRLLSKKPFVDGNDSSSYCRPLHNLNISRCYNCAEVAVWLGEGMIWPRRGSVARPNPDMPAEALSDYEEASEIVDQSPRGAAALLRLAIQRICIELGGAGKNLNDDIATLVKNGLDKRVQKALDVVRVIGNNAVHPGELDLRDDREITEKLFELINLIVDIMISQPSHVEKMFAELPSGSLEAIGKRDK